MPSESGRMPLGSRAAKIPSRDRITSEKAPRTSSSASAIAPASVGACERAIRWTITSESEVVVKSAPFASSDRPDLPGVDEVAVVREAERAAARREDDRLGVGQQRGARRRVPDVPDGRAARQARQARLAEDVGDVAHLPLDVDLAVLERGDAGRLLAPVLEGIEAEVGEVGGILRIADAEDAAFVGETAPIAHWKHILTLERLDLIPVAPPVIRSAARGLVRIERRWHALSDRLPRCLARSRRARARGRRSRSASDRRLPAPKR